ncbi:MAG: RHS repeat protein, partial [Acidobacteria bacterium]|nr:RHS repeat protein [Acidobacteriota bacterium]
MTRFRKALKTITNTAFFAVAQRKAAVVVVMLGIMMPTAAPIPLWAADLDLPPVPDDGLRLTASESPLERSMRDLLKSLTSDPASLFTAPADDKAGGEALAAGAALEKQVAGIRTELGQHQEIEVGQIISLGARPLDKKGEIVNGVGAKWQCANSKIVRILNDSQAIALTAGEAKLSVRSGSVVKEITVLVKKNVRDAEAHATVLNQDPETPVYTEELAANLVTPENNLGNPVGQSEIGSRAAASAIMTRERYGSSNFSFDIPAASLPGRGIDASIGLTYNSRVWNKSGSGQTTTYNFNIDGNWIAPGFEMGYGELVPYGWGSVGGYMLTSPSGTRHQLAYRQASGGCSIYESNDGTFIRTTICGHYVQSSVNVIFPDGTQVMYGTSTSSGKRFPIRINDRNGNMMTIAYVQGDSQGKILYIQDTLNRYINFYYEPTGDKKLVAITVPGFDGGAERQTIRFYYADMSFDWRGRFDGSIAPEMATVKVLKYVYFPGTQTGFKYDYSPTFGMIYKIWQLRGMQVSGTSTTETGTVTNEGTWAAWTNYNYPTTQVPTLTDVPKYTERTDDWKGRTSAIPQTSFMVAEDITGPTTDCVISSGTCTGTRTVTVTAPDGTRNISVSKIKPTSDWENGLLKETRIETGPVGSVKVWSKTSLFWEQGANSQMAGRDNPRLDKIEVTNDAGQTRATSFDYDIYNNQTVVREHDFAAAGTLGTELRRTETTYETGNGWIVNRLLHLPKEVKTIVGGQAVSKTVYEYDNNGLDLLVRRADISNSAHDRRYNPNTPPRTGCFRNCNPDIIDCCWEVPLYLEATRFRGNVTKITTFSDATLPVDQNASVSTMKYDITGNVTESSSSCCELKTTQYVVANQYAFPMSQTRSGQGLSMTTSATYDLNTGLMKTATDENGQVSSLTYDTSNLRVTRTDGPAGTGAWTTTEYNDATFPYSVKTTQSLDAARSVSSWSFINGRGQAFRGRSQTTDGYLSSEVEFDIMGRPEKSYSPHTVANLTDGLPSGIKFSLAAARDGLGRTLSTTLPDDTHVYAYPNEETVTVTYPDSSQVMGTVSRAKDQADKERRQIVDALGRLVRVDEPTAAGLGAAASPNQPTFYKYDGNDNLTKVIQSDGTNIQERLFKYDSLSRLTHEKQVEATATLDNSGVHVGAAGLWTGVYKYDAENLLIEGFDARGVKTAFTYDGLNRVKTVVYTGETGYQTPTVTYTYDEAESGFYNNGRLTKVQTAANAAYGTPETVQNYDYDKLGQAVKHVQSIGNQSYSLEYGYNLAGQLVSEKYPSGRVVTMAVDNFGRLSGVADGQRTYLSGITINDKGLLTQINLGNGTSESFSYNDRFQMDSQSLLRGSDVLQKYDYGYGTVDLATGNVNTTQNNGQLGKVEGWIGADKQWSQRFGYDELGRLKEAREYKQGDNAQLTYKQVFDFDRFGNLYRKAASNPIAGQQNPLAYTAIEDTHIDKATNRFTSNTTY